MIEPSSDSGHVDDGGGEGEHFEEYADESEANSYPILFQPLLLGLLQK